LLNILLQLVYNKSLLKHNHIIRIVYYVKRERKDSET